MKYGICLLLAILASEASGGTLASVSCYAGDSVIPASAQDPIGRPVSASCNNSGVRTQADVSSASYAANGILEVSGNSTFAFVTPGSGASVSLPVEALAHSGWSDDITINSPGRTGTGLMTFSMAPLWGGVVLSSDGNGWTSVTLSFQAVTNTGAVITDSLVEYLSRSGDTVTRVDTLTNPFQATGVIPFTFGRPFIIGASLDISTNVGSYGIPSIYVAAIDASHSAYWGGIDSVSTDGTSVDYTVTSASGTDYRYSTAPAVPEASTVILMCFGLSVILLRNWRRKTRSR